MVQNLVAVVAPEENCGVVIQTQLLERVDHLAHQVIHIAGEEEEKKKKRKKEKRKKEIKKEKEKENGGSTMRGDAA